LLALGLLSGFALTTLGLFLRFTLLALRPFALVSRVALGPFTLGLLACRPLGPFLGFSFCLLALLFRLATLTLGLFLRLALCALALEARVVLTNFFVFSFTAFPAALTQPIARGLHSAASTFT